MPRLFLEELISQELLPTHYLRPLFSHPTTTTLGSPASRIRRLPPWCWLNAIIFSLSYKPDTKYKGHKRGEKKGETIWLLHDWGIRNPRFAAMSLHELAFMCGVFICFKLPLTVNGRWKLSSIPHIWTISPMWTVWLWEPRWTNVSQPEQPLGKMGRNPTYFIGQWWRSLRKRM